MAIQYSRRIPDLEDPTEAQIQTINEIERLGEGALVLRNNEQQGLFPFHGRTNETSTSEQDLCNIDIFAVHGLGGDAYRTWQHDSGFNWLQSLDKVLPGIRTYSYGYESLAAFGTGVIGLTDYARHLLTLIKSTRIAAKQAERKIIFVCHGTGGLLAKQAILLTHNERGLYDSIRESIAAVLFFGTPQSGNYGESFSVTLFNMCEAIMFPALVDQINEYSRTGLTAMFQTSAPYLAKQNEQYRSHVYAVKSVVFIETTPLPGVDKVLVDDQSGRAWTPNERCLYMPDQNHREICKFASLECEAFRPALDELQDIIKELLISTSTLELQADIISNSVDAADRFRSDAILKATIAGNILVVKRLIANKANVNTCNAKLETLLHLACRHGHTDVATFLLEQRANVLAADATGSTPLHEAAAAGEETLVTAILDRGGDPNSKDQNRCTPLHHAACVGSHPIAASLIAAGADCLIPNARGEIPAGVARRNNHELVKLYLRLHVLKNHESVNLALERELRSNGGYMTAAERSRLLTAQNFPNALVVHFEPDSKVQQRASRLAKAAERGDYQTVRNMIDLGIQPDPDALYLAAKEHRADVVALLADVMPDIDADVGWRGNALCAASCSDDGYATVRTLLEKGANINWQGGKYGGALQSASINSALSVVKLLLKHGADVNAQAGHYGNAITAAARHRNNFREMATLFVQHGVDINAQGPGEYGNALQTAVHRYHVENVEFLLRHGASKTMPGRFGSAQEITRGDEFLSGRSRVDERERIIFLLKDENDLLNELFAEDLKMG